MNFSLFAEKIETRGVSNDRGRKIFETATLLHFLRICDHKVCSFKHVDVERGKAWIQKNLFT